MNNPFIFKVVTLYFTNAVSIETGEHFELVFGMEAGRFVVCVRACVRACVCVCVCVMMRPGNWTGPALTIGFQVIVTIIYRHFCENTVPHRVGPYPVRFGPHYSLVTSLI